MPLVKVKDKYQVTLPAALREKAGLEVGDLLEAKVEGKKITLTPKAVLDRDVLQSLTRTGLRRARKPFASANRLLRSPNRESKTTKKKFS